MHHLGPLLTTNDVTYRAESMNCLHSLHKISKFDLRKKLINLDKILDVVNCTWFCPRGWTCFNPCRPCAGVIWKLYLTIMIVWPCIVTDSLWIKSTDALNSNFIGITTLHFSGSLSAHHQEFLAVHRLWYILCSCDRLLPGVGWNAVPSYSWQQTVTTA